MQPCSSAQACSSGSCSLLPNPLYALLYSAWFKSSERAEGSANTWELDRPSSQWHRRRKYCSRWILPVLRRDQECRRGRVVDHAISIAYNQISFAYTRISLHLRLRHKRIVMTGPYRHSIISLWLPDIQEVVTFEVNISIFTRSGA